MRNLSAIPSVRGERSPSATSPPSPTCAVRPSSAEFRPDTLDTGPPPSLARRAASAAALAHAAIVRDRPPRGLHPHARHDYRLWLIRLNMPRARPRASPIRPSSYGDRSASPTLPAPPPCAPRLFSVLLPPPARSAVAMRALRIHRCDVSPSTAASCPGFTLPHSRHDLIAQHHPHVQHVRRPLTIPDAASLTLPLVSAIVTAFAPTRLAAAPAARQCPPARLDPSLHRLPLPPSLPPYSARKRGCGWAARDPASRGAHGMGRAESECVKLQRVCPSPTMYSTERFRPRVV